MSHLCQLSIECDKLFVPIEVLGSIGSIDCWEYLQCYGISWWTIENINSLNIVDILLQFYKTLRESGGLSYRMLREKLAVEFSPHSLRAGGAT